MQKYPLDNTLIAVPFDKGAGFCAMTCAEKQEEVLDCEQIRKLKKTFGYERNWKNWLSFTKLSVPLEHNRRGCTD